MPKDIHVEPEKFAAELISKLEGVLREREAQEKLEEKLKRVRLVSPEHKRLTSCPHQEHHIIIIIHLICNALFIQKNLRVPHTASYRVVGDLLVTVFRRI